MTLANHYRVPLATFTALHPRDVASEIAVLKYDEFRAYYAAYPSLKPRERLALVRSTHWMDRLIVARARREAV